MEFKENIKIKVALLEEGMTQKELSETAGISIGLISLGLNGRYLFRKEQRESIAKALNRKVSQLFVEE